MLYQITGHPQTSINFLQESVIMDTNRKQNQKHLEAISAILV